MVGQEEPSAVFWIDSTKSIEEVNASAPEPEHDTVWLKDGQVLYGSLKDLEVGVFTFNANTIGDVKLKHFDLVSLRATTKTYRISTLHDGELIGWMYPMDTGWVQVVHLLDTTQLRISELVSIEGLEEGFLKRWSGQINAGYSYTRSSQISRYNADAAIQYRGENVELHLSGASIFTGIEDSLVREREEVSSLLNVYFADHWSVFTGLIYQRNQTLGLQYRYQGGPGVTYIRYFNNQVRIAFGGGTVANREANFSGVELNSIEGVIQMTFYFFRYQSPKITLSTEQAGFFGFTESGRFRHDGEIRLAWEIVSDLSLNLQLYDNYDNQSPQTGGPLLDYGVVMGVGYSF